MVLERHLTKWSYEAVLAEDGTQAWEALRRPDAPKLAIVDWLMPGMNGVDLVREIRRHIHDRYVYVLLLTTRNHKQDLVEALNSGADDYLVKPFDPSELEARLQVGLRILQLQEELSAALQSAEFAATHDRLTGLWNRGGMVDALGRELARSSREITPLAVILSDLDHFKQINDDHGHLAGDAVLQAVGERIRGGVRPYDLAGRYGGEEFLIIAPNCHLPDAGALAERLRSVFAATPVEYSGGEIQFTASFGVACSYDGGGGVDGLLNAADTALYRAKRLGRNRVEIDDVGRASAR